MGSGAVVSLSCSSRFLDGASDGSELRSDLAVASVGDTFNSSLVSAD